ncbi:helix-turn-helix domain-containing protein [Lactiplantibacillus nangangensis]|uniref:helix-turn-helix domain-containing protein n=1 Tax=Lactiplantibacillus nangangensis TaxID=2559917 RepID=UPI0039C8ED3F
MSEPIAVILGDEQAAALRDFVYKTVSDSVAAAKRDAGVSQKWLRKTQAASYAGVSTGTFGSWVKEYNLPCHIINGATLFNKNDIDRFINHNGNLK